MAERMTVVLVGEGAIARRHMQALRRIDGVEVLGAAAGSAEATAAFPAEFAVARHGVDLADQLGAGVDAAILASPTPLHAAHALQVMEAGKDVLVEIPMADNLAD